MVRETCPSDASCVAGACTTTPPPTSVTISANFGSASPIHTAALSVTSLTGTPSFSEDLSTLPDLRSVVPNVLSPPLGLCAPTMSFTLNRGQVAAFIEGPSPACIGFVEDAAERGIVVTMSDVPLPSSGTIDVRLEMTP